MAVDEKQEEPPEGGLAASGQIDNLLRTTKLQITMMTQMADQKASIMTGLSVVMLSIIFGYVQTNGATASLAVFGLAVLFAAMTAIIAVMPSGKKPGTKLSVNPLFFGHISTMSESGYVDEMQTVLASEPRAYDTLLRDIYQLSLVTQRKYRLVGISYKILLTGFIASTIALVAELVSRSWNL